MFFDDVGELGALAVGGDEDLKVTALDLRAKVKVAEGRDVGDVYRNAFFPGQITDVTGSVRVIDGCENHVNPLEVLSTRKIAIMIKNDIGVLLEQIERLGV